MTPSHRSRNGCETAQNLRWRNAAPPVTSLKRIDGAPKPWPIVPHPKRQVHRSHFHSPPPLPHLRLFHTRHAEESAERPHLVTVVRPCSQSPLRKVTVLLNRRGVASYDQLLLDISEALGFPRWHRARVTRLYTTHAQEVKGVCDFFRGEVAFLALGKARPELSSVQEAVEELFPEHSQYRADALQAWEKKLRPAPDKAAKADSGYSDGTDGSETHTNRGTHPEANTRVKHPANTHKVKQPPQHIDAQPSEKHVSDAQTRHKSNSCRKTAHLPNHLQRLHVRGGVRERQPSVIGLLKHKESLREADLSSTTLCGNCLARREEPRQPERINPLAPLPPVSRKQKQGSNSEPVRISSPPPPLSSREEEKSHLHLSDPHPNLSRAPKGLQSKTTFDLSPDGSDVTQADIERCYEIGRVVGDGNFAVVRECRHRGNGQTLAVKIVERSKLIGREHMMQNELSLLGSLCHPRIVRLFAHHHTHTHSYLLMELVRGGDLFEAISERGKFSEPEAGLMVSDMGEALNYIHSKSIVHRDLKPENLLIEHEAAGLCRLKLGDFGLAMVVTEPVFTICGTPTYVAPEILCEMGYGVAVDVWALGVILFVLLCGFPPFRSRDRDQEELFQLIKQGQIHFLSPYWDSISEEARGLVRVLLQPDPRVRLTAEQTLLHPWVEAMTSICQQRALVDKNQRNTGDTEAEPDRVQRLDQANAAVTGTDITPLYSPGEGLIRHKKLGRHEDRQTEMSAGGRIRVQTPSEATAGQQKPERTTTDSISPCKETSRREIQAPGSKLSYRNCDPGSLIIKAHEC